MKESIKINSVGNLLGMVLLILIIVISAPIIIIFMFYWLIKTAVFLLLVRTKWYSQKKFLLFAYSDSPKWKGYIETDLTKKISKHSEIINFSERKKWKNGQFKVKIFRHFTGMWSSIFNSATHKRSGKFSPVAIVFIPWWKPRIINFEESFRHFKLGNIGTLSNTISQIQNLIQKTYYWKK